MPGTDLISETIFVNTSMLSVSPGTAGTPVIKSWVMKVRITTDLWNEVTFSMGLLSKWIGISTRGIWLNLLLASWFAFKTCKLKTLNFGFFSKIVCSFTNFFFYLPDLPNDQLVVKLKSQMESTLWVSHQSQDVPQLLQKCR